MTTEQLLTNILQQLHETTGRKHDIHYKDGFGVLAVPEGYPLEPRFVVLTISHFHLQVIAMNGGRININQR